MFSKINYTIVLQNGDNNEERFLLFDFLTLGLETPEGCYLQFCCIQTKKNEKDQTLLMEMLVIYKKYKYLPWKLF